MATNLDRLIARETQESEEALDATSLTWHRLLATSRLSVKEIAARVGFSDSHYFSRIFKEMTGERPTEYTFDSNDLVFN